MRKKFTKKVIALMAAVTVCFGTIGGYASAAVISDDVPPSLFTFDVELEEVTPTAAPAKSESKAKLSKSSMTMLVGATRTLKVTGTNSTESWSGTDKSVCTVSASGKVKAVGEGTAKVIAKVGNKKLYCTVKVVKSHIQPVTDKTINKGDKITLSAKLYNVKSISAYSTDKSVVKVSKSYISNDKAKVTVTAVSSGTAYIYIKDKNNSSVSTKVKITVKNPTAKQTVSPPSTPVDTNALSDTSSDNSGTVSIRIQALDNGDGTTRFIIIPSNGDDPTENSSTNKDNDNTSSGSFAEDVLKIVNEERAAVGAAPLVLDDELCRAAQVRAVEGGEYFSHTRPDGRICFSILTDMNINATNWGENLAQGSSTAKGAMNQWMNSTGHRENLLSTSWRKMGVGYDSATNTWCQLFTN